MLKKYSLFIFHMLDRPKASQKDIFLHFLVMFTLYISAISFTSVLFQIINITIPDPLLNFGYGYMYDGARGILRTALSFLVVMFPVCVYSTRLLNKSYEENKERTQLRIRKSIIYFTLFIVSFIIMFTLVFLLNQFLKGELTLRFFLKLASTLFVAGSIFGYYRWDLQRFKEQDISSVTRS